MFRYNTILLLSNFFFLINHFAPSSDHVWSFRNHQFLFLPVEGCIDHFKCFYLVSFFSAIYHMLLLYAIQKPNEIFNQSSTVILTQNTI